MSFFKKDCSKGKHRLKMIYNHKIDSSEENVVRWCDICGAIVVDGEFDGRIYAGKIRKMILPENTKLDLIDVRENLNLKRGYLFHHKRRK